LVEESPSTVQNGKNSETSTTPTISVSTPEAVPPKLPPKPVRDTARVLYGYTAQQPDELDLKEGDLITILFKDCEDKGWWKGELNGKVKFKSIFLCNLTSINLIVGFKLVLE